MKTTTLNNDSSIQNFYDDFFRNTGISQLVRFPVNHIHDLVGLFPQNQFSKEFKYFPIFFCSIATLIVLSKSVPD